MTRTSSTTDSTTHLRIFNPVRFLFGGEPPDEAVAVMGAIGGFVDGAGKSPALGGISHRIAAFVRDFIWPRVHVVLEQKTALIGAAQYAGSHAA